MGCSSSFCGSGAPETIRSKLEAGVRNAQSRCGRASVAGRYHRPPQALEDVYAIEEMSVLGSGYNGSVLRAVHKLTGKAYAVKSFSMRGLSRSKAELLQAEAEIYLAMDHPNIARLVDVYEGPDRFHLVMECMTGGELLERIQERRRFSEVDTSRCVWQMLRAVSYLHSHGVVHRDLKLQNFLFESPESNHLKLIDFGFSQLWRPEDTTMKAFVGTLSYMAPEVVCFRARYTSQCDLWSLGVICYALLVGRMPFRGTEADQLRDIRYGAWRTTAPDIWDALSNRAQDFVGKLLTVDPEARMTAADALQHPFVTAFSQSRRRSGCHEQVEPEVVKALVSYSKTTQLRRAVMEVMAWSLSTEDQAAVREQFAAMDKNCEGTITMEELRSALTRSGVSEGSIRPIFRALDGAKDEEIHYSEFLAAMVSTRIAMHEDLLKATFRRFDKDCSGSITVENLKDMLGDSFDGVAVADLLKEADTRKDGKISYEEFVEYLLHEPPPCPEVDTSMTPSPTVATSRAIMRRTAVDIIDGELDRQAASGLPRRRPSLFLPASLVASVCSGIRRPSATPPAAAAASSAGGRAVGQGCAAPLLACFPMLTLKTVPA